MSKIHRHANDEVNQLKKLLIGNIMTREGSEHLKVTGKLKGLLGTRQTD